MANVQERMDMIGSSILSQAQSESKGLIAKANYEREHELALFEEQVIQNMFGTIQKKSADIRAGTVREISATQTAARRALLKKRSELSDLVFASVRAGLKAYTKTPEYTKVMLAELGSLANKYSHASSTVFIREADMELAGTIEAALNGAKVKPDAAIRIGGWKLLNAEAGILIDETLDSRLLGQKTWFLENSGLTLGGNV